MVGPPNPIGSAAIHAMIRSAHTHTQGAMHQITQRVVATYRGIELGWVPIGKPRNQSETERLLSLVNRIRPDYVNKVKTFSTF